MAFERGRRLGVDVGLARVGVASCDPDGILATPVETIAVSDGPEAEPAPWAAEITRLLELAEEYEALAVVVGIPASLRGGHTASTKMAASFVSVLRERIPDSIAVFTADERLSTVQASSNLRAAGKKAKKQRSVIDQAAAVAILQTWLDSARAARW
ncbi:Holliday junction resolvase RuvX [Dietzia sp.]|uniref:Holliday junction resolvase RuvX n=1 Tax=Dietzia sp. TaxID=1871616 RepID=UPI002FDABEE9